MQHLFVYGTLRPGGGNHGLLDHPSIAVQAATASGLGLYAGPGFPYAAVLPGHTITGTLYAVPEDQWPDRLTGLDLLEGYRPGQEHASHYLRRRWPVTATATGRAVQAWIYLAGPRARPLTPQLLISSGDWMRRR